MFAVTTPDIFDEDFGIFPRVFVATIQHLFDEMSGHNRMFFLRYWDIFRRVCVDRTEHSRGNIIFSKARVDTSEKRNIKLIVGLNRSVNIFIYCM